MTPILAKLDELKVLADKATPWLGKFQDQSMAAVLVTVDADDFRQMLKMCTAMPQLVEALRVAVLALVNCTDSEYCGQRGQYCDNHTAITRIQAILQGK